MPPVLLITNLSRSELSSLVTSLQHPEYRAKQIWQWLYEKRVASWDNMANLPAPLRATLSAQYRIRGVTPECTEGRPHTTQKILGRLADNELVEEVLIPAEKRRTVCVSTQVGCKFRCAFCASGQSGFQRSLEPGEIVSQVLLAADTYKEKPSHVVFMGMGEPFDNYDSVLKTVRILNDHEGLDIGARRMTISTSGVVPGIRRLAEEGIQVELSVSLHAPEEELRSRLMPVNRIHPLTELIPACRDYTEKTGRIITFEYTLIHSINDTVEHARKLAMLLEPFPCRVNLIPLSPVKEFEGQSPSRPAVDEFMRILTKHRINNTLRMSKGTSLDAACGQLRRRTMTGKTP